MTFGGEFCFQPSDIRKNSDELRSVTNDLSKPPRVPLLVTNRRNHDICQESRAILPYAPEETSVVENLSEEQLSEMNVVQR
jgi:hypothetical protein